jgi:ssRNA-specific RNase YbeY (16S rRNA maturation enzyme)
MLHLLGYDHMDEVEEATMILHQKDILNEMGLKR